MPYKLRKAPKRDLYWVVGEDGSKKSKDPIPRKRAEAQMRALYASENQMKGSGAEMSIIADGFRRYRRFTTPERKNAENDIAGFMIGEYFNKGVDADFIYDNAFEKLKKDYPYVIEEELYEVCDIGITDLKNQVVHERRVREYNQAVAARRAQAQAQALAQAFLLQQAQAQAEADALLRRRQENFMRLEANKYQRRVNNEVKRTNKRGIDIKGNPDTRRRR